MSPVALAKRVPLTKPLIPQDGQLRDVTVCRVDEWDSVTRYSGEEAWSLCGEQVAGKMFPLKDQMRGVRSGSKMSIQLQIEEMPGYLVVSFVGTGTREDFWQQVELIPEHCKRANKNKLLLDFIGAYTYGEVELADRYFFWEHARILAQCNVVKVAVVVRPERVDPERFADMVAQSRGLTFSRRQTLVC